MYHRTEDLLTLRDEEPIDAHVRSRILADPRCVAEIERLRNMRDALRELPQLDPPAGGWERITVRVALWERGRSRSSMRWAAGVAIAAGVAVAAIVVLGGRGGVPSPTDTVPMTTVATGPQISPIADAGRAAPTNGASYVDLVQESARLERVLARMPGQRPLMSAETATTIVALEDRITFIDEQLTFATAEGVEPPQRHALWSERVDLMNALVQVRFAQAQRVGF